MAICKWDWRIKDVVRATGLGYDFVRRALISGELDGLVAPRLLRTNEQAVAEWLSLLRVSPPSKTPPATSAPPVRRRRSRGAHKAYKFVDPDTFGKRN